MQHVYACGENHRDFLYHLYKIRFLIERLKQKKMKTKPKLIKSALLVSHSKALLG